MSESGVPKEQQPAPSVRTYLERRLEAVTPDQMQTLIYELNDADEYWGIAEYMAECRHRLLTFLLGEKP